MPSIDRRRLVGFGAAGALAAALPGPVAAAPPAPRTATLPDGTTVPALGMGSWHMAERGTPEAAQAAMTLGLSLGLTLVDTAEIYGGGKSEQLIAPVIAGKRDGIFLVSKVWPTHATADGIEAALRASLARLGTDHLDLYLLHAPRGADMATVVPAFEHVRALGLTRRWGVSNFTAAQMEALFAIEHGANCATNQVLYNLANRAIEADLIPWCEKHKMPIMAYSPLGAGGTASLLSDPTLGRVAAARGVTPAAVALAWAMRDGRTIALVESGSSPHIREDAVAATLVLGDSEIAALDAAFPPPRAG